MRAEHSYPTLEIIQMEVGLLQNFCEVIGCPGTGEAALVDPAFAVDRLLAAAEERGWRVTTILLTHTHSDHIEGLSEAVRATGATVWCHPLEVTTAGQHASEVRAVLDQQEIALGHGVVRAIHAPGHTPGCVCWFVPDIPALMSGDVLFVGSCGHLRSPGADPRAMYETLTERLATLPEETIIYPGHDYGDAPTSNLGWELFSNPGMSAQSYDQFCQRLHIRRFGARRR